jgi:hypothetical protein
MARYAKVPSISYVKGRIRNKGYSHYADTQAPSVDALTRRPHRPETYA